MMKNEPFTRTQRAKRGMMPLPPEARRARLLAYVRWVRDSVQDTDYRLSQRIDSELRYNLANHVGALPTFTQVRDTLALMGYGYADPEALLELDRILGA